MAKTEEKLGSVKLEPIDALVRYYEQRWKLAADSISCHNATRATAQPVTISGPLEHSLRFRGELVTGAPSREIDWDRFVFDPHDPESLSLYPAMLWEWVRWGRRVYAVPLKEELLHRYTSTDHLSWDGIHLPYGTYAIQLEEGIEHADGIWNFIIVSTLVNPRTYVKTVSILVCDRRLQTAQFAYGAKEQERVSRLMMKGEWDRASDHIAKVFQDRSWADFSVKCLALAVHQGTETTLSDALQLFCERQGIEHSESDEQVIGLVVSLSHFLVTNRKERSSAAQSNLITVRPKQSPRSPSKVFGGDLDLCVVQTVADFDPALERAIRSRAKGVSIPDIFRALNVFPRKGYYRRPDGEGANPAAKRSQWQPACFITLGSADQSQSQMHPGAFQRVHV